MGDFSTDVSTILPAPAISSSRGCVSQAHRLPPLLRPCGSRWPGPPVPRSPGPASPRPQDGGAGAGSALAPGEGGKTVFCPGRGLGRDGTSAGLHPAARIHLGVGNGLLGHGGVLRAMVE